MASKGGHTVVTTQSQLVLEAYKPPSDVRMLKRQHLERFMEAAENAGVGFQWPVWRVSLEVGSRLFNEMAKSGAQSLKSDWPR